MKTSTSLVLFSCLIISGCEWFNFGNDTPDLEIDISDMQMIDPTRFQVTELDTQRTTVTQLAAEFKSQRCKRRFPVNRFKFTIKGEGINIPVKDGKALNIGEVELGAEVGTALTEAVLIMDGYTEQLCQTRNIVGQIAMACGQSDQFYKFVNLQTSSHNALVMFFISLRSANTEAAVQAQITLLRDKIEELDKAMAQ